MLSFMFAQYSLFQQGYNLLDELDPYMKKLAAEVSRVSSSPLNTRSTSWALSFSLITLISCRISSVLFLTIDKSQLRYLSVRFPRNDWNLVTHCTTFIYRLLKASPSAWTRACSITAVWCTLLMSQQVCDLSRRTALMLHCQILT